MSGILFSACFENNLLTLNMVPTLNLVQSQRIAFRPQYPLKTMPVEQLSN